VFRFGSRPSASAERTRDEGFTYVGAKVGGRLYSNWKHGGPSIGRFDHFVKWSPEIRMTLAFLFTALLTMWAFSGAGGEFALRLPVVFLELTALVVGAAAFRESQRAGQVIAATLMGAFIVAELSGEEQIRAVTAFTAIATSFGFGLIVFVKLTLGDIQRSKLWKAMPLPDEPSPVLLLPISVCLYSDGLFLGSDVGWVGFVDKFLHFQGTALEFSLLGEAVNVRRHRSGSAVWDDYGIELLWRDGERKLMAHLEPLEERFYAKRRVLDMLRQWVTVWSKFAKPDEQIGTYPPNYASNDAIVERRSSLARVKRAKWITLCASPFLFWIATYRLSALEEFSMAAILGCMSIYYSLVAGQIATQLETVPRNVLGGRE
jgi:hypothetical protein